MKARSAILAALTISAPALCAHAQSAPVAHANTNANTNTNAPSATSSSRPVNTVPPPPVTVFLPAEQEYSGGPLPPDSHVEHRSNQLLMGAGATVFLAAYVPFAVDGVWQSVRRRDTGVAESARDEVAIWYTVPIVGPYLYAAALNQREQDRFAQLQRQNSNHTGFSCNRDSNVTNTDNWCSNAGSAQPQTGATSVAAGEWIWATVLAGSQVYGLVMFVAGMLGHRAVVHDPPRAGAAADGTGSERARARSRRATWRLDPGAGPTPVGMTLSVITF